MFDCANDVIVVDMRKLYCYVDETGQDVTSKIFIVVAVVSGDDQNSLKQKLLETENDAKIGQRKWHKSKAERRLKYLQLVLQKKLGAGEVYFSEYKKPLPYFLPLIDILEKAIADQSVVDYQAVVYIDGIDRKKAAELTNALRLRQVRLLMVRGSRDESEPVIRLADRWAGCIRLALMGNKEANEIFHQAKSLGYLIALTK